MQKNRSFIQNVFNGVYDKYDIMNHIMSLGLHRAWKRDFMAVIKKNQGSDILDIASGTGDIAKLLSNKYKIIASDPSMLMMSKYTGNKICCVAESLPFRNQTFDAVTASFGYRNFSNQEKALKEIARVLKSNGTFYCMEFAGIQGIENKYALSIYKAWLKTIPYIGKVVAKNQASYQYLSDSIINLPHPDNIKDTIIKSGFNDVEYITLGAGIVAIYICNKKNTVKLSQSLER